MARRQERGPHREGASTLRPLCANRNGISDGEECPRPPAGRCKSLLHQRTVPAVLASLSRVQGAARAVALLLGACPWLLLHGFRSRTIPQSSSTATERPLFVTFDTLVGDLAHRLSVVALTSMGHRGGTKSSIWDGVSEMAFWRVVRSRQHELHPQRSYRQLAQNR